MKKGKKKLIGAVVIVATVAVGVIASKGFISKAGSADNKTTIYYEGYSNPNIHYQVANGDWTTAPGKAMEANSELEGFSYKVTIDLGSAEEITACFNDGNNNWDNNDKKNYKFGIGEYSFVNGQISKIDLKSGKTEGLAVTEIKADKEAPQTVGTTIKLTFKTVNEAAYRYNTNDFIIEKDGESVTQTGGMGRYLEWTPCEAGTYSITVYVADYIGQTASKTIEYTVVDESNELKCDNTEADNEVTVYYNGSENTNIHYQIGNGEWTEVPGVAMDKCDDVEGYTCVYTVDLGEADTLTACFNDGNGNWDSKYGANYKFEAGTYYVSNYTISNCPQ